MQRFMVCKIVGILLLLCGYLHAEKLPAVRDYQEDISSLIIKDVASKKILYTKGAKQRLRPASLTKIMTALLAIESGKMNHVIKITPEATKAVPIKADLKAGERIYLRDLVKSALISSANDSAVAIGIGVAGSTKRFVQMMNKKARQLGMKNTRFTNPMGLDVGDNYSTAEDLLKLVEYAIKNKTFNAIVKLEQHKFSPKNRPKKQYIAKTSNRLLRDYKYAIGVKTGYTAKAGPCLIARAKKGKKDILLVMLNSRSRRWESATRILDEALGISPIKVAQKSQQQESFQKKSNHQKIVEFSTAKFITPY